MDKYQTCIHRGPAVARAMEPGTGLSINPDIDPGINSKTALKQALGAAPRGVPSTSASPGASMAVTRPPHNRLVSAVAIAGSAIVMSLFAPGAAAEITEDCILEGTVDMRMAEQLGQPVYVRFRSAERGSEARCSLNRRSNSRRVRFISRPDEHDLDDASHGDRVRYRYTERDGNPGTWELIEVSKR